MSEINNKLSDMKIAGVINPAYHTTPEPIMRIWDLKILREMILFDASKKHDLVNNLEESGHFMIKVNNNKQKE